MVNVRYCECGKKLKKLAKKYCSECAAIHRKISLQKANEKRRIVKYCECGRQLDKWAKKYCSECSEVYRQISMSISLANQYEAHKKRTLEYHYRKKITRKMIREDVHNATVEQNKVNNSRRSL